MRFLPDTHAESVDVLVELIQQGDALDDHVVHPIDVELDLSPGVAVPKTQLGDSRTLGSETLHQIVKMKPYAAYDLGHCSGVIAFDLQRLGDTSTQFGIRDTQDYLLLLAGFGDSRVEEQLQVFGNYALGHAVDVLEGGEGSLEGREADQLDYLVEAGQIRDGGLELGQEHADFLELLDGEEGVAGSVLVQDEQLRLEYREK